MTTWPGWAIGRSKSDRGRVFWLVMSCVTNLGLLAVFKYYNFFVSSLNHVLLYAGGEALLPAARLTLPVGISFYTFQSMSYTIDVYRGELAPERSFVRFALYVDVFPPTGCRSYSSQHAVHASALSGHQPSRRPDPLGMPPVPRWTDQEGADRRSRPPAWLTSSLHRPRVCPALRSGWPRWPSAYRSTAISRATPTWLVASDACSATTFPSTSTSPTWPAASRNSGGGGTSLSRTWLRDYLYIPLGGNRHGTANTYRNLMLTMTLGGLWHGAGWNFVFWGVYQGVGLALERAFGIHDQRGQRRAVSAGDPPPRGGTDSGRCAAPWRAGCFASTWSFWDGCCSASTVSTISCTVFANTCSSISIFTWRPFGIGRAGPFLAIGIMAAFIILHVISWRVGTLAAALDRLGRPAPAGGVPGGVHRPVCAVARRPGRLHLLPVLTGEAIGAIRTRCRSRTRCPRSPRLVMR